LGPSKLRFLTRVSVLDRMCGGLCDAVLETRRSALTLEELASSNLFVVPLDHERRWYRLHHLFREMLREELERREPGVVRELSTRAAEWCENQGDIESAIEYTHQSDDFERLARLVSANVMPTFWSGRIATLGRWLSWFDDPTLLGLFPAVTV